MKHEKGTRVAHTLQRLWRDFPELWGICDRWEFDLDAHVPTVSVLTAEMMGQQMETGQWWAVVSKGGEIPVLQCRVLLQLEKRDRNLKTTLNIYVPASSATVEYIVHRPSGAQQMQQLKIYKPPRGRTIMELASNIISTP